MSRVIPCASATALPSAITAHASSRVGGSATWPCVRPVSAAMAFEAALKISLRHCAPRASGSAWVGIPARVQASASSLDLLHRRRAGLEGTDVRVALRVPADVPGLDHVPGGERRPADDLAHVLCNQLLVARAVLDRADRSVLEGMRARGDRLRRVHALHGDDPEIAGRERARIGDGLDTTDDLAGTGEPEALGVDRVDVLLPRVVRPDLDAVERAEVGGEERADGAATDDSDSHSQYEFSSRALTSRYMAVWSGTGMPFRAASRTRAPVMKSISVARPARTSSSIDGTCA